MRDDEDERVRERDGENKMIERERDTARKRDREVYRKFE